MFLKRYHHLIGTSSYWDDVVRRVSEHPYLDPAFARQRKAMHLALLAAWAPDLQGKVALKTDLFEEATGDDQFFFDLSNRSAHGVGMDFSSEVARRAGKRASKAGVSKFSSVAADIRRLPFKSRTMDIIVSNSTLDHFATKREIIDSIVETARILKPGGQFIVTLDNPWNPMYAVLKVLSTLRITPYYLGKSLTRKQLMTALTDSGFVVEEIQALSHHPRIIMLAYTRIARNMLGMKADRHLDTVLALFDKLKNTRIRYATAAFIAIKARRIGT